MDLSLYLQVCLTTLLLSGSLYGLFYIFDNLTVFSKYYKINYIFDKGKWIFLIPVLLSVLAILLGLIWGWL